MRAADRSGGYAGASIKGEVCPRPTNREIEDFVRRTFPGISGAMVRRVARMSGSYDEAARIARRKLSAPAEASGTLGYRDPTGNLAATLADQPSADSQCDFYRGRVVA